MITASAAYEVIEAEYLRLVRAGSDRATLAAAARATAKACEEGESAEDALLSDLDEQEEPQYQACYDVTEVLADLWADIAAAHDGV